ncbi:MAG: amidohydrolase family protein [Anaerolineae bacterium]
MAPSLFLDNCTLIDATHSRPRPGMAVVITDTRIAEIALATELRPAAGQHVVDLSGAYLLPGLWDCHCHLGVYYPDPNAESLFETPAERTLRALRHATDALQAGVTALRAAGEPAYIDVALRDAFAAGLQVGPRLFVSGPPLKVTGGHGAYRRRAPVFLDAPTRDAFPSTDPWGGMELDGPDGFRYGARLNIKMGVDWIKLFVTGGVAGGRESMTELQMSAAEIEAAVDTAHSKGLKVMAHLGGPDAVRIAVGAGVDSVEHGYTLDEDAVALMAEKRVWYVPTLGVTHNEAYMRRMGWAAVAVEKALAAAPNHQRAFQMAVAAGVRIANGSDLHPLAQTTTAEIEQMVRCGMTPWDALVAATRNAAEMCGALGDLGTIESGKLADLIVVRDNPMDDIRCLKQMAMVILNGTIVRNGFKEQS